MATESYIFWAIAGVRVLIISSAPPRNEAEPPAGVASLAASRSDLEPPPPESPAFEYFMGNELPKFPFYNASSNSAWRSGCRCALVAGRNQKAEMDGEGKIDNIIRDRNNAALKESPSERAEPVARPLDSSSQAACTAERFVRARCLAVAEESPKMSAMLKSGNGRASQLGIDLGA